MWNLFFGLCFVTCVIFIIVDYKDIGNTQFVCTAFAFIVYLLFLSKEYVVVLPDMENSCLFDKYIALPIKIKDMISTEMDQYIKIMAGMKDVMGNDPVEQSVDEMTYAKNKDPAITISGVVQLDAFSNLREEYFAIDKVFRDLLVTNSNMYIDKVYNRGNALP
jgi:hypothetical protein